MTLGRLGPYELVERLAVGGMAEVFRARGGPKRGSVPPGDIVIKRMLPHLRDEAEFVDLFVEEARILKTLKHRNIVRVFDFGEVDGQLFLAMELVDGLDGYRLCRRAGLRGTTVPWDLSLSIAVDV